MGFYEECFWAGLRLPLHPFFMVLLQYFKISPCMVVPNAWRHIYGFTMVCVLAGVVLNVIFFHFLFSLKWHLDPYGWWYVTLWRKKDSFHTSSRFYNRETRKTRKTLKRAFLLTLTLQLEISQRRMR